MVLNYYRLQFLLESIEKRRKKLEESNDEEHAKIQNEFYTLRLEILDRFEIEHAESKDSKIINEDDKVVDGPVHDDDELDIKELQFDLVFGIDDLAYYDLDNEFCNTNKDFIIYYLTFFIILFSGFYFTSMAYITCGIHLAYQPIDDETETQDSLDSVTISQFAVKAHMIGARIGRKKSTKRKTDPAGLLRIPGSDERVSGYNKFTYYITSNDYVNDDLYYDAPDYSLNN